MVIGLPNESPSVSAAVKTCAMWTSASTARLKTRSDSATTAKSGTIAASTSRWMSAAPVTAASTTRAGISVSVSRRSAPPPAISMSNLPVKRLGSGATGPPAASGSPSSRRISAPKMPAVPLAAKVPSSPPSSTATTFSSCSSFADAESMKKEDCPWASSRTPRTRSKCQSKLRFTSSRVPSRAEINGSSPSARSRSMRSLALPARVSENSYRVCSAFVVTSIRSSSIRSPSAASRPSLTAAGVTASPAGVGVEKFRKASEMWRAMPPASLVASCVPISGMGAANTSRSRRVCTASK
ncbi:MAG: hypothetical protein AW07_04047 [Candidatus Accumulibacter sp. SK-11]|nr:MAG: hypothetical protein AW07_04047 [Candidatus Accumulibacter sp. SK-11]